jgi:spoIIIJ-associated protein
MDGRNKTIDIDGFTVEDAIQKALKILKVSRDSIHVKVVCEEKKGLFGMGGSKPAKIKVTLKNIAESC